MEPPKYIINRIAIDYKWNNLTILSTKTELETGEYI